MSIISYPSSNNGGSSDCHGDTNIFYISGITGDSIAMKTDVANVSAYLQNQINGLDTRVLALSASQKIISANVVNISGVVSSIVAITGSFATKVEVANVTGYLQNQIDINTALDANQATQIAQLSGNVSSLLVGLSGSYISYSAVAGLTGSLQTQITSISAQLPLYTLLTTTAGISAGLDARLSANTALDANQATLIAQLSGNVSSIQSTLSGSFISYTAVAGLTGSLQSQIIDIVNLDNNQASQILAVSGANISQATQIASISSQLGLYTPLTTTASISASLLGIIASISGQGGQSFAVQIAELSGNAGSQATQIAQISGQLPLFTLLTTTTNISANLQAQITALQPESTTIASSGGSIIVSKTGSAFNIEVSPIFAGSGSIIDLGNRINTDSVFDGGSRI
jgi:hypothetical protein